MQQFKKAQTTSLSCPNCGSKVDLRLPGKSMTLKCDYCGSIIDTQSEQLDIVGKFEQNANIKPLIELGSYGIFEDTKFQLIGFLRKTDSDGGKWDEYLLFNPYRGYRYLSYWQGHWNYITLLQGVPFYKTGHPVTASDHYGNVKLGKRDYKYFYHYSAKVNYVLGEFNWKVKKGEKNEIVDYINPPYLISGESSSDSVVWSLAKYVDRSFIQKAFALENKFPKAKYIAPNQPNPNRKKLWAALALFVLLFTSVTIFQTQKVSQTDFKTIYNEIKIIDMATQQLKRQGRNIFKEFQINLGDIEITGNQAKNFHFNIGTNVRNTWMYLTFYLMNEKNNQGYTFAEEISYYYGYSGGESWSEGSRSASFTTPYIKPGKYLLMAIGQSNQGYRFRYRSRNYNKLKLSIKIIRGYLGYGIWVWAFFALLVPVIISFFKVRGFEKKRNQ